jgi:hypothetical protein
MTKAERDLLLLVADWLVMAIARQGCVPHHLVDAIECVGSEGRRKAHPNTAILLAAEAELARGQSFAANASVAGSLIRNVCDIRPARAS